jgi:hypothetical protein
MLRMRTIPIEYHTKGPETIPCPFKDSKIPTNKREMNIN